VRVSVSVIEHDWQANIHTTPRMHPPHHVFPVRVPQRRVMVDRDTCSINLVRMWQSFVQWFVGSSGQPSRDRLQYGWRMMTMMRETRSCFRIEPTFDDYLLDRVMQYGAWYWSCWRSPGPCLCLLLHHHQDGS